METVSEYNYIQLQTAPGAVQCYILAKDNMTAPTASFRISVQHHPDIAAAVISNKHVNIFTGIDPHSQHSARDQIAPLRNTHIHRLISNIDRVQLTELQAAQLLQTRHKPVHSGNWVRNADWVSSGSMLLDVHRDSKDY